MMNNSLDNKEVERRLFLRRMTVSLFVVALMLVVLVARLFYLQVIEHEKHQSLSDNNRLEVLPIAPIRGLIYDRNGELLAENLPSHTLSIVADRSKNIDDLIQKLRDLIEISDEEVESFNKRRKYGRPFDPVPLKIKLTEHEIAILAANRIFLDGALVEAELIRQYPHGDAFAHVLGYVGRINEKELQTLNAGDYAGIRFIGKQGIERQYEDVLLGKAGYQRVETNARGRILNVLEKSPPEPGANLHLQLDRALQQKAYDLLEGKKGAVVAIEPNSGGILALVSRPSYDPNLFVTGFPSVLYNELRDSPTKPFLNRAIRGTYPAASTIKPFIGLAGVDQGFTTWTTTRDDNGVYIIPNTEEPKSDWKRGGHGIVNLTDAIEESVDTFFYDLAYKMKLEPIHDILDQFGFGKNTAWDIYNPLVGINPTREWKKNKYDLSWYAGDTVNLGIGQGYMLTTPTQLAISTAVMANKGQWMTPRLLLYSNDEQLMDIPEQFQADVQLKDEGNWDKMHFAMQEVLYGKHGTAWRSAVGAQYRFAGKTGTAQVIKIPRDDEGNPLDDDVPDHLKDHALFIAFAPVENPQIALAVVVENGGGGSAVAAPIARELLDEYLLRETNIAE
jgi:penicillin-binding protein 2